MQETNVSSPPRTVLDDNPEEGIHIFDGSMGGVAAMKLTPQDGNEKFLCWVLYLGNPVQDVNLISIPSTVFENIPLEGIQTIDGHPGGVAMAIIPSMVMRKTCARFCTHETLLYRTCI